MGPRIEVTLIMYIPQEVGQVLNQILMLILKW
jgi:hypothetical protein